MTDEYPGGEHAAERTALLSDSTYDFFKNVVQLYLPGLGTLYFAIAAIWGLPFADEIVGTIAAVTVFLGLFLKASVKSYNNDETRFDGFVHVTNHEDDTSSVNIKLDPAALANKDEVKVKVNRVG